MKWKHLLLPHYQWFFESVCWWLPMERQLRGCFLFFGAELDWGYCESSLRASLCWRRGRGEWSKRGRERNWVFSTFYYLCLVQTTSVEKGPQVESFEYKWRTYCFSQGCKEMEPSEHQPSMQGSWGLEKRKQCNHNDRNDKCPRQVWFPGFQGTDILDLLGIPGAPNQHYKA